MINLLPPETRQSISYARRNVKLIRWIASMIIGISFIGVIVLFGLFFINRSSHDYQSRIEASREQLKIQKLDETQKRVKDISTSLKLVVQVLGKEVLFSKLLQQIGSVMPTGSSLSGLSINKVQGGIDLNAVTKDYNTATQVQVNLQDPINKIFEKTELVSITCNNSNPTDPNYPCQVNLRASFATDNPFLFIHDSGVKK